MHLHLLRMGIGAVVLAWGSGCGSSSASPDAPPAPPCSAPTGAGTMHNTYITSDELWAASTSPHIITGNISIQGATLTIEPCAVVRIANGMSVTIGATSGAPAKLIARGEMIANAGTDPTRRPVVIERAAATAPWGMLRVFPTGSIDLETADLSGGADPATAQNLGGMVIGNGDGNGQPVVKNVRVVDVTIEGSAGFGINMQTGSAFTDDSANVVVRGAGAIPSGTSIDTSYPVYLDGPAISSLPTGTYTGNAKDEIFVANASGLTTDVTFHARGVPYRFETNFSMAPTMTSDQGGLSTLTIEPGVTIRFTSGAPSAAWAMTLGVSSGMLPNQIWPVRLIANGTPAAPIVLTSAEPTPAAGDWAGIKWAAGVADGNVMSHVTVDYAGGDSGTVGFGCGQSDNDAALIIRNWRPGNAFITESTFAHSAAGGIVSGWRSDLDGPNLGAGNTFTEIANGCNTTRWANDNGSCPSTPPICL
ncbi:MAG: hypothetical protein AB7L28_06190 [Kofleriaceae bacterium]